MGDIKKTIERVAQKLESKYHNPTHFNKKDPFNELIFILCSLRTTENQYIKTYSKIKATYPKHNDLLQASPETLSEIMGQGGLSKQKAECLIKCAEQIKEKFGRVTLSPLLKWTDQECEGFLTTLPRMGIKSARCIMMYSLGREVFPVDTHCWRVGIRLGWVRNTTSDNQPRKKEMDRYQKKIPSHLRYSLHVNLVALGRDKCLSRKPNCKTCPINMECMQIGLKNKKRLNK